jgi:hypothetical protein
MQPHPTPDSTAAAATRGVSSAFAPPSAREVAVLQRMLGATQVPGVEQLRDQVRMLLVHPDSDAALRIYSLHPDTPSPGSAPPGRVRLDPFPVLSPQGRIVGAISIWVQDGLLRALHFDRHDDQPVFVLPPPERIQVPETAQVAAQVPDAVRVTGGRQARLGQRTVGMPAVLAARVPAAPAALSAAPAAPRRARRMSGIAAGVLLLAVIGVVAFSAGASRGVDLDAARASGTAAGASEGAASGAVLGTWLGSTEGTLAGRVSTYRPAFDTAQKQVMATARAEKLAAQQAAEKAAAAAAAAVVAAPRSTDNTSCAGYRDASGYWVCS